MVSDQVSLGGIFAFLADCQSINYREVHSVTGNNMSFRHIPLCTVFAAGPNTEHSAVPASHMELYGTAVHNGLLDEELEGRPF